MGNKDLEIETTGPWPLVTFWETVALSTTNDLYFENYVKRNDLDLRELRKDGDRRLDAKIETLKHHPEIKLAEFGTRRRFSSDWQNHVIDRLEAEAPESYLGTSNVEESKRNGTPPIGSYAHEMEMTYAAIDGPQDATQEVLDDWRGTYGDDLGIALSDTFTSDQFMHAFTKDRAEVWSGVRHDSGDPFEFGEKVIGFYEGLGINPKTKTILFSDSLDVPTMVKLQGSVRRPRPCRVRCGHEPDERPWPRAAECGDEGEGG